MSISSSIANDKLVELRNKRMLAIQALDFETAEKLDEEIRIQNDLSVTERVDKINQDIMKELTEHMNKFQHQKQELELSFKKLEDQLASSFQDLLNKTRKQHKKELVNIDKAHSTSLLREADREVPEQFNLLEQAKAAAIQGDYMRAKQLRDEARRVGEEQLYIRQDKVNKEFAESRNLLATKQQEALDLITNKYDSEISMLEREKQQKKDELDFRYQEGLAVIRQKAEVRCKSLIADEEIKENALFTINQNIEAAVREFGTSDPTAKQTATDRLRSKK